MGHDFIRCVSRSSCHSALLHQFLGTSNSRVTGSMAARTGRMMAGLYCHACDSYWRPLPTSPPPDDEELACPGCDSTFVERMSSGRSEPVRRSPEELAAQLIADASLPGNFQELLSHFQVSSPAHTYDLLCVCVLCALCLDTLLR